MADFLTAHKRTAFYEGGYANDKDDAGGETWRGIARTRHPNWPGWFIVDGHKKQPGFHDSLAKDEALQVMVEAFYRANFWNAIHGDDIADQEAANNIYDSAVNIGVAPAIRLAQEALGITVDGVMGPFTINKLNNKA
jgi:lysozyme family protein